MLVIAGRKVYSVSANQLVGEAKSLKSEDGENKEYDRALVEMVTFLAGGTSDDLATVAAQLGVPWPQSK